MLVNLLQDTLYHDPVINSPRQKAHQINILMPRQIAGTWTIFEVVPESSDGACGTVQERG